MTQNEIATTISVGGMSCPNCELRIENELKALSGLISVKANYSAENVSVVYDSLVMKETEIIAALERIGYKVKSIGEQSTQLNNSKKSFNKLGIIVLLGIAAAIVVILFAVSNTTELSLSSLTPNTGYGILFVIGLVTSLHCIAMCGGINLSLCMSYKARENNKLSKLIPSILYNAGRVISYTLIGGVVGALGSVINISQGARGISGIIIGAFMILMGLNMIGISPALRKFIPRMPKMFGSKLYNGIGKNSPLIIGLLNGLMPCGPLQSVQLYALGTGSPLAGALSMFLFSLGTVPAMFGFGTISSMLSKAFTEKMMKVSAILVMLLGAFMLAMGLRPR